MFSPTSSDTTEPRPSETAGCGSTLPWRRLPHPIRWLLVAVTGGATLVTGLVLLVFPGPGIPLVILGLVILASEFAWAERTLHQVRRRSGAVLTSITRKTKRRGSFQ